MTTEPYTQEQVATHERMARTVLESGERAFGSQLMKQARVVLGIAAYAEQQRERADNQEFLKNCAENALRNTQIELNEQREAWGKTND